MLLNQSSLHSYILKHIIDIGRAPKIDEMVRFFDVQRQELVHVLRDLQEYHGVVLHPKSHEVWVIHPFSTAPTPFWIESKSGSWWGNCAWCALGAAALLNQDLMITTTLGGESKQIRIPIKNGEIQNQNLFIHFPIPMVDAWDNVIFTCSTMLVFDSDQAIVDWCTRHGIDKGDVQPIGKIWAFPKVWY